MTTFLIPPLGPQDHAQGPPDAPLALVEYGDYECPYCGAAYPIITSIRERLGDRLLFGYRHFPLTQMHPHAQHAAEMAEVADVHGKFWPMHDLLFRHQHALNDEALAAYAGRIGIDAVWAARELETHAFAGQVRQHFMSGVRSGVNGTPTFFINGVRYDGTWDETSLLDALGRVLYAERR